MVLTGAFMGIQPRRKIENGGIHLEKIAQEISRMRHFKLKADNVQLYSHGLGNYD